MPSTRFFLLVLVIAAAAFSAALPIAPEPHEPSHNIASSSVEHVEENVSSIKLHVRHSINPPGFTGRKACPSSGSSVDESFALLDRTHRPVTRSRERRGWDVYSAATRLWETATSYAGYGAAGSGAAGQDAYDAVKLHATESATAPFTAKGLKADPVVVSQAVESAMSNILKPSENGGIPYGFAEMSVVSSIAGNHAADAIARQNAELVAFGRTEAATVLTKPKFPIGPIPEGELPGQYYAPFSDQPRAKPLPASRYTPANTPNIKGEAAAGTPAVTGQKATDAEAIRSRQGAVKTGRPSDAVPLEGKKEGGGVLWMPSGTDLERQKKFAAAAADREKQARNAAAAADRERQVKHATAAPEPASGVSPDFKKKSGHFSRFSFGKTKKPVAANQA